MKRILCLYFVLIALTNGVMSQTSTRGTLVNTSTNRVSVYARPNSTVNPVLFRNVLITVSIADQGAGNPTVTLDSNYIPNLTWVAEPVVISAGRVYYTFNGSDNGLLTTTTWTANGNNKVATLLFSNSNGLATVQLNDETPSGGSNGLMFWYVEIQAGTSSDITDYTNKFYGTNPVPVNNESSPSFVGAQSTAILPVLLKDFNVIKKGNTDAQLIWTTAMEQNVNYFVLERSATGTNGWTKFAEVKAVGNSSRPNTYNYSDVKVYDGASAAKVVFYRIKSVDLDGQEKLFPVRSLRFTATGGKDVSIYPNPARDGFTLSVPLVRPIGTKVRLSLVNRMGQVVHTREINGVTAANYYYDIKTPGIISGEYMLQILVDGDLLDTKKVIVQR